MTSVWSAVKFGFEEACWEYMLFETEADALKRASVMCIDHMIDCGYDNPGESDEAVSAYKVYNEIVAYYDAGKYSNAVDVYSEWNTDSNAPDLRLYIYVEERLVIPKGFNNANYNLPLTKKSINPTKSIDVSCKVCGRNVNENESNCWYCGVDNPARK
jgi:hypothetical protein